MGLVAKMPKFLKEWLKSLNKSESGELGRYLDQELVTNDLIQVLYENHDWQNDEW